MDSTPSFALLNDPIRITQSSDVELSTSISNILSLCSTNSNSNNNNQQQQNKDQQQQQQPQKPISIVFPKITLETVAALIKRFSAEDEDGHLNNNNQNQNQQQQQQHDPVSFFCLEQLKVLITTYFSAAAKYAENLSMVETWFTTCTTTTSDENNQIDSTTANYITTTLENQIVAPLLKTLSQESHSLVTGEMLRLFLQCSPTFLRTFVLFTTTNTSAGTNNNNENPPTATTTFDQTSMGMIAPMLTDNSALKNHSAWQVMFAILETDLITHRPSRFVVEFLAKNHLHSFLNVLISCLRHSNPASRRFTLRFISDMFQTFGDWSPVSHCVLQSPAIFYALLANAEGPPCPEHWQVYHIVKMFITFPNKCPMMRHLFYINRDALGQYAQSCASRFSVYPGETTTIMAKLAAMTPLTNEEAALIQVGL